MSAAGGSAERWARQLRADARRGVWRCLLALLGVRVHTRAADARAAQCEAGAIGEQRTARLLQPLEAAGWTVLHDRAIPDARSANADHVLVSPGGRVFLVDSKMWSARYLVHGAGGQLWHGPAGREQADRSRVVKSLLFETELVARAVRAAVQPVIAVHNAPVDGGGFFVEGIPVVPADRLVELLVVNDGPPDPGALWLARHVERVLPPYAGGA